MRLNLGCGLNKIPGFIGVDLIPQADIVCDIRKLPEEWENSADEIMSAHCIEHFYEWEVNDLLLEWKRVLKPGGLMVIECPDLMKCCMHFLNDPNNHKFGLWGFYGDPQYRTDLQVHKYGYTPESLMERLAKLGFKNILEAEPRYKKRNKRDMRVECTK